MLGLVLLLLLVLLFFLLRLLLLFLELFLVSELSRPWDPASPARELAWVQQGQAQGQVWQGREQEQEQVWAGREHQQREVEGRGTEPEQGRAQVAPGGPTKKKDGYSRVSPHDLQPK